MAGAAALLAILDAVIISTSPNLTRVGFALVVTLIVGYIIIMIWRSNSRLEKAAANQKKGPAPGGKPPAGRRSGTQGKRQ
jgi:hypothetical protein